MDEKIIAGNFKSNFNRKETISYLNKLNHIKTNHKIFIFPAISSIVENNFNNITLGAQNCYFAQNGAFTGEITLKHLEEFEINTIIIGHSERRNLFLESDDICAKKFHFFKEQKFCIFYCIGESLEIRNSNKELEFLKKQLEVIDLNYKNLIIAYEPIWAIGTGVNAELNQIKDCISYLKTLSKAPIIYGGSVNEDNAKDILKITDGILVGNASLNINKFNHIIKEGK
ncbi:triose-phosphate isomerase [Helicobacter sp. MIT 14-3879]|uniref:triose-phosphate isomerase n=1 Tax=Helicobacter sp. MIT 14-3879 TaxID=2040649 RepID=UPI000E1EF1DB|nr:triose-phosphate isomerase [Helicobacter sp. MIT 14-3879]RDU64829.1 triose-phosphate isomerase [Helicobacter sp. MIT 14-3879]